MNQASSFVPSIIEWHWCYFAENNLGFCSLDWSRERGHFLHHSSQGWSGIPKHTPFSPTTRSQSIFSIPIFLISIFTHHFSPSLPILMCIQKLWLEEILLILDMFAVVANQEKDPVADLIGNTYFLISIFIHHFSSFSFYSGVHTDILAS